MAPRHGKKFTLTSTLVAAQIRAVGEQRGFAAARLLTHWPETVGTALAATCRPVKITYGRAGVGATLVLLTTGAQAPMLEMQRDEIRQKVNAVYGYNAIARIQITQTAAVGFAEGQAQFSPAPPAKAAANPPEIQQKAESITHSVQDTGLRLALEALAANVLVKSNGKPKGAQ
ncbi:hypothetical protein BVG79_02399 [Ketogulonicigenium robustum]|uniref:DUF721 domain-containing protein n=1 Tax=Ketogulonicigenium robustum TaxID=92947 RepID=A0A1W6P2S9_9RHOB|nr:DUF721 domain-containing protein [Ketogulonicigenium robustum]ARO15739.1 hypothetical protein BVG79_02399 [Ketogulonicigenium robustum]